jgi:FkbM family methyltransferase
MRGRRTLIAVFEAVLPGWLMGGLRRAKRRAARACFRSRVVRHTYGGKSLAVEIGTPYGEGYDQDWPQLAEIELLRQHRLQPGARVFDLGANHGLIAMMLADVVGPQGVVVAVESGGHEAGLTRRNAARNALEQIVCLRAAVASRSGWASVGVNGEVDDGTGRWGRIRVPAVSIDDLATRWGRPDVVFMDIEGFEGEALLGAKQTLANRPDWFVEVHTGGLLERYGGSIEAILASFPPSDYRRLVARDGLGYDPKGKFVSVTNFEPLESAPRALLGQRFFLVALGR